MHDTSNNFFLLSYLSIVTFNMIDLSLTEFYARVLLSFNVPYLLLGEESYVLTSEIREVKYPLLSGTSL